MAFELFDKRKPGLKELEKLSKRMSRKFKVDKTWIKIGHKQRALQYFSITDTILITSRAIFPIEHLLHEFAHHIVYHKHYYRTGPHRKPFQKTLWKLVMWYYKGNPEKYNWVNEYPRVAAYGFKRLSGLNKRRANLAGLN